MLEIRLLGQFAVHLDGRPVDLPARAAQALLAFLVLNAPRRQPRERLAGLLWPDADDEAARQGLRNALWKLRAAVGEQHLVADKLTIGLAEEAPWWSDVSALSDLDETGATDDALAAAVEAYAGDLLPGFYDDWVAIERERLSAAFERKVAALVSRLEAAERWPEAMAWAERWLARAGAAEPAYRTLMRAHAALGDRAGVGAAYRRCEAALEEDLGMPPSEATLALYRRLSQASASPAAAPAPLPAVPLEGPAFLAEGADRRLDGPGLAAREAELAVLTSAVDDAVAGRGRLVLLAGEAGEGKSTLLDALTAQALARHPEVVVARGTSDAFVGGGRAFGPFADAFRMLAGDVEAAWAAGRLSTVQARRLWALLPAVVEALLGRARPLLGTLIDGASLARHAAAFAAAAPLPGLAELLASVAGDDLGRARLEQAALFEACADFLLGLAHTRPVVLLIDDMHWMDTASADLLLHLSRRLAGTRLLIVGAYRTEEASPAPGAGLPLASLIGELQRTAGRATVTLGSGSEAAARAFVDALIDREPNDLPEAFRAALTRHTGGHALFTVELLDDLKERGAIVRDEAGRWTAPAPLVPAGLPGRVEGVLQSRFGRLDDELHRALAIAAVEGEEFTAEVVAAVAGLDTWRLLERLASEAGRRHRLVDELGPVRAGARRLSRFRFRHNLFQRFLYDGLGPSVRPHLHEAVASALAGLYGEDGATAVALSRHYLAAELPERAVPHLLAAGRAANRLSAHHAASGHLEQALAALAAMPAGPERDARELDVRLELTVALHVTAGFSAPAIATHAGRAVALAEVAGDGDARFRALWNMWLHHVACYAMGPAQATADALLAVAGDDPGRRLQAHHAAWSVCYQVGDHHAGRQHLEAAAPLYDPARHGELMAAYGGHDPGVCRLCYTARADLHEGRFTEAEAHIAEALALAEQLGHAYGVSQALMIAGEIAAGSRGYAETVEAAEKAIAYADLHGFPFWRSYAVLSWGLAKAWLGDPAGLAAIRGFIADYAATPEEASPSMLAREACACLGLGLVEEGLAAVTAGLAALDRTGEGAARAELHRLRGELLWLGGEAASSAVAAELEQAAAIAAEQGSPPLVYRAVLALAHLWEGSPREAEGRARLEAALARLPNGPPPATLTRIRAAAQEAH